MYREATLENAFPAIEMALKRNDASVKVVDNRIDTTLKENNKFTLAIITDHSAKAFRLSIKSLIAELRTRSTLSKEYLQINVIDSGKPDHSKSDPFYLQTLVKKNEADAFVLVVSNRWGARRLLPNPVVNGCPVAIVQASYTTDAEKRQGNPDPDAPWVVAAMAKDIFLKPTDQWANDLVDSGRKVLDLRADRARRDDLLQALVKGPQIVLYAGHGRNRGWAGYQALRLAHFDRQEKNSSTSAIGLVIAFACDTLTRTRNRTPFGSELVQKGIVRSYLGAADIIQTTDAEALSKIFIWVLIHLKPSTVFELMKVVDKLVEEDSSAAAAWRKFRLIGDLTTKIDG